MSGHSKWSTIKHKKAKEDAKRGKLFTKLIREITVAAREGGGDPAGNPRLRLAVERAKSANMPQDNISRAIKKGTGELEGLSYESATYEGFGPGGMAVIVETLSDNKKRTVAAIRHLFSKAGGSLAENGAVAWMFEHKGVLRVAAEKKDEEELYEQLLEFDIDDISFSDSIAVITCEIKDLDKVRKQLEEAGFKIDDLQIEWVPKELIQINDSAQEQKIYKFLESLEDLDDVQNVYTNLG